MSLLRVKKRGVGLDIIQSGVIHGFDERSGGEIDLSTPENPKEHITIRFAFVTNYCDRECKSFVEYDAKNRIFTIICQNFEDGRHSTLEPLDVGSINGRKLYLVYWIHEWQSDVRLFRKIEYTLYVDPEKEPVEEDNPRKKRTKKRRYKKDKKQKSKKVSDRKDTKNDGSVRE